MRRIFSSLVTAGIVVFGMLPVIALAMAISQFAQTISDGVKSVDIVNAVGAPVASPGISFSALTFSFDTQTSTGTLGTSAERIRVFNPTGSPVWTVSLAAEGGTSSLWSSGSATYDFNDVATAADGADVDSVGGSMNVATTAASLAGLGNCSTAGITLGANTVFSEGVVDSATLVSGGISTPTYCRWDLTNVGLSQVIPAEQTVGAYTLNMSITIA